MIKLAAIRKDGIVYTGRRHDIILSEAETKHGLGFGGLKNAEQGFVNHKGVFFDRYEAAQIALSHGQIKKMPDSLQLYSEDLAFLMIKPKQRPAIQKIIDTLHVLHKKASDAQDTFELGTIDYHYQLGVRTGLQRGIMLLQEQGEENRLLAGIQLIKAAIAHRWHKLKQWNWSLFVFVLILSCMGALSNKTVKHVTDGFILAALFGTPTGLLWEWLTRDEPAKR